MIIYHAFPPITYNVTHFVLLFRPFLSLLLSIFLLLFLSLLSYLLFLSSEKSNLIPEAK